MDKLLAKAMRFFYVPEPVIRLMMQYYDCKMRFSTRNFSIEWHRLEVGIAQGCTISMIWFVLVIEMLLRSSECSEKKRASRPLKRYLWTTSHYSTGKWKS